MMSMEEMFYGPKEDVWIVKPEKKEEVKKGETPPKPPLPTALEESFGTYFPYYHPPYTPQPAAAPKKTPDTKNVDFKIPICCTECIENLRVALLDVKGVQKVNGDIDKEKVTVAVKNDANIDDVLLRCRKIFKKSRLWTKDD